MVFLKFAMFIQENQRVGFAKPKGMKQKQKMKDNLQSSPSCDSDTSLVPSLSIQ